MLVPLLGQSGMLGSSGFAPSSDQLKVIEAVADTSGGTQDFEDLDITSFKAAIFLVSGVSTDDSVTASARMSMGFVDSSGNSTCVGPRSQDATTVQNTVTGAANASCILIIDNVTNGLAVARASHSANLANGVRLTWDVTPTVAFKITCILFGGDGEGFTGTTNGTTGGNANTDSGFAGSFLVTASVQGSFGSPFGNNNDVVGSLGFAINNVAEDQAALILGWNDLDDPSDGDAIVRTDKGAGGIQNGSEENVTISAWSSSGFTSTSSSGSPDFCYLNYRLADTARTAAVAVEILPSGTGTTAFTGLGIRPEVAIHASTLVSSSDTLTSGATACAVGYGALDSEVERSQAMSHEVGISNGFSRSADSYGDAVALSLIDDAASVASKATMESLDTLGLTLDFSVATAGRMVLFGISSGQTLVEADDTVQVSEAFQLTKGITPGADTVQISEGVSLTKGLSVGEVVEISEGTVVLATVIVRASASPLGFVDTSGSQRGLVDSSGSVVGQIN